MAKTKKETKWFRDQLTIFGEGRTPKHLMNATNLTRFGEVDIESRLFRRNKVMKQRARQEAVLNMPGEGGAESGKLPFPKLARGTYHATTVGVGFHKKRKMRTEESEAQTSAPKMTDVEQYKQNRIMEEREQLEHDYA